MVKKFRLEIFSPREGGWFWHVKARNGKLIMDGSESYASLSSIRRAVGKLPLDFNKIEIVEKGSI